MESKIELSIIIVNYNTFQLTCCCIDSIVAKTERVNYEIVLVDNGSSKGSPELFKKKYPSIVLLQNQQNVGFGVANNQAMSIARGTYFLLINSDTYLVNNAIDVAFKFAIGNFPKFHVFGANILNEDLSEQNSYYHYQAINVSNTLKQAFLHDNPIFSRFLKRKKSGKIGGLYGAYVFLHKEVFETLNGFDPDFFMYCEDTEWFRNRINKKYNILICKEAQVVHFGGGSGAKSQLVNPQNVVSYFLYWYKLGRVHYWTFLFGSIINNVFRILLLPFMSKIERFRNITTIKFFFQNIRFFFLDIPRYDNSFGARSKSLNIKKD